MLNDEAYKAFQKRNQDISIDEWVINCENKIPQFKYWNITLRFEMQLLDFIKSLREGNFSGYVSSLLNLTA